MKDRRQINLREYFSYLEMLIEKEKLNLYDVVEIEYLIARFASDAGKKGGSH